ncbi:corticotropin-releasing factor receptor 2-like [Penaeus japonicus]|uniref:corticotropin-releasing factor receptor 2-like n=1 Tax=Penaeus japonicus TaxID=27405 RepID=UPI001C713290|nr:corticotropin-releasing factor receptor 2-like [Penaeus japonicus]XP_042860910.1 corticotropin-releasing factor receptor 2-like [Penaeus japonicus]XP_042860911.1 corticotropin-releasing factor receptor 2-like [Penaeus japonicus]XP_042860912.1 corticotropin-releasing factor receptor 2-like [Penaeus japonicus]
MSAGCQKAKGALALAILLLSAWGAPRVSAQDTGDLPSTRRAPPTPSHVSSASPSDARATRSSSSPSPSASSSRPSPSLSSSSAFSPSLSNSSSSPLPQTCRMGYVIKSDLPTIDGYYHHLTCFWCYQFTPSHRRKTDLVIKREVTTLSDGTKWAEFVFVVGNETYYFDVEDPVAWGHVQDSLHDPLEASKLEGCCRDALTCCEETPLDSRGEEGSCPRTWDGWMCFPDTPPGDTVSFTCPSYAYKSRSECALEGTKTCWANGSWLQDERGVEKTEYATCSHRVYHIRNYAWEIAMHALSLVAVVPAICMILYFRALRVQRFYLHLNFLLALFGKALMSILDLVVMRIPEYSGDSSVMDENTVGCRFLVFLTKVFSLAVWTWMLAESLYLHRLIVAALRGGGKTWMYLLVGWVPPFLLSGAWATARGVLEDYQCWLGDDHGDAKDLYLITELPKLIILVVNTGLLVNMTRVLMSHLKNTNTDSSTANRRAVKASTFLLPMFGLQFFVTFFVPPFTTPCAGMQAYVFIATAIDGLQGLYIAVVYCYMNNEVRIQVRRSTHHIWQRLPTSAPDVTYDRRTDASHIHSGAGVSVATMASTVD